MAEDGEDAYVEYDSGPFCRHWSDPADCDIVCHHCGHTCTEHEIESPGECRESVDAAPPPEVERRCPCPGWKDKEDESEQS